MEWSQHPAAWHRVWWCRSHDELGPLPTLRRLACLRQADGCEHGSGVRVAKTMYQSVMWGGDHQCSVGECLSFIHTHAHGGHSKQSVDKEMLSIALSRHRNVPGSQYAALYAHVQRSWLQMHPSQG